jgi:hypothetical protein
MWSCAMAGVHCLEAYHHADRTTDETLFQDGIINRFMEKTDFHLMEPRDDLALKSTKWILARPGESYIAYTYDYLDRIGIKNFTAGNYDLLWFDTISGEIQIQNDVTVKWGNAAFSKPDNFGNEIAVYIKRKE